MRRTVSVEMLSTIPSSMSCLANSMQSHCERDLPATAGRSQAILTRWIATCGGEKRLSTSPRFIVKAKEPLLLEPLGPFVNGSPCHSDGVSNAGDRDAIGEQKDDPGPSGLTMADGG